MSDLLARSLDAGQEGSGGLTDAVGHNRLATLAASIRALDAAIRRSAEQIAREAVEAGKLLIEAKGLLRHGEWLPWLREHVAMSERTATRYMRLARSGLEIGHVADLGIAAAARVGRPRAARAQPVPQVVTEAVDAGMADEEWEEYEWTNEELADYVLVAIGTLKSPDCDAHRLIAAMRPQGPRVLLTLRRDVKNAIETLNALLRALPNE
jgi:hypothetical protein